MNKEFDSDFKEHFSKDSLISIASVDICGNPWVRTVDSIYIDGAFYNITHNSNEIKECIRIYDSTTGTGRKFIQTHS